MWILILLWVQHCIRPRTCWFYLFPLINWQPMLQWPWFLYEIDALTWVILIIWNMTQIFNPFVTKGLINFVQWSHVGYVWMRHNALSIMVKEFLGSDQKWPRNWEKTESRTTHAPVKSRMLLEQELSHKSPFFVNIVSTAQLIVKILSLHSSTDWIHHFGRWFNPLSPNLIFMILI